MNLMSIIQSDLFSIFRKSCHLLICVIFAYYKYQSTSSCFTFVDGDCFIPPPPPPPCFNITEEPKLKHHEKTKTHNDRERIREELFNKLNLQNPNKKKIGIRRTPESYINQYSTPSEVQEWLKAKRFGDEVCEQLQGINGHSLFNATKSDLENICDEKEGRRLFSQVNLQKSFSGVSLLE